MRYLWFFIFLASTLYAIDGEELLQEVNTARARNDLPALRHDQQLSSISQKWAIHLIQSNVFDHRPDLKHFLDTYRTITENLFKSYGAPSARRVVTAWMNSNGHRHNLLDRHTTMAGFGIYRTGTVYIIVYNGASL
jgi:uncharacterized protein YkwD